MKRILLLLIMVSTLALPAAAQSTPDPTRQGSISITMRYDGKPVSGGELTLYRVGVIMQEDENYGFTLSEEFASADVSLGNIQSSETAKKLAVYANHYDISGQTEKINTKGKVTFEDLQTGLYLLVQKNAAPGFYSVNPFLVSLPVRTNDDYSYHVDASPKVSPLPVLPPENPEQPKTGQSSWPIRVFILSGSMLAILLCHKKPFGYRK